LFYVNNLLALNLSLWLKVLSLRINLIIMKKIVLAPLALAAAAGLAFTFQTAVTPIEIGTSIPKAEVKMVNVMNDQSVSLTELKTDKGLLVMFSCNTCPYVISNERRIVEAQQMAKRYGIGVAVVNSNEAKRDNEDSKDAMKKYGNDQKYTAPYLVDVNSEMADAFGATRTPECFLFDKDGKLVYRGAIDDSPKDQKAVKNRYLTDALTAVFKGQEITTKTTVSVGCSIKRKAQ